MKASDAYRDALWPGGLACVGCGCASHGQSLCDDCRHLLAECAPEGPLCPLCGHPLTEEPCPFCSGETLLLSRAAWRHRGLARELVLSLKNGRAACADPLGEGMAEAARELPLTDKTVVTWVTMPTERWRERAYDHAQLLAQAVGERLGLPCLQLISRTEGAGLRHQVGLNREERLRNLRGSFFCQKQLAVPVLLVDDVTTTGSTGRLCAEALTEAGAERVMLVTATQA